MTDQELVEAIRQERSKADAAYSAVLKEAFGIFKQHIIKAHRMVTEAGKKWCEQCDGTGVNDNPDSRFYGYGCSKCGGTREIGGNGFHD